MHCSDRVYHTNDFGVTSKCNCLDAVHVVFGNVSLLLTRRQCRDFCTYVSEAAQAELFVMSDAHERSIYIPTRDDALLFALTYVELKQLDDLLRQTILMFEVDDALTGGA